MSKDNVLWVHGQREGMADFICRWLLLRRPRRAAHNFRVSKVHQNINPVELIELAKSGRLLQCKAHAISSPAVYSLGLTKSCRNFLCCTVCKAGEEVPNPRKVLDVCRQAKHESPELSYHVHVASIQYSLQERQRQDGWQVDIQRGRIWAHLLQGAPTLPPSCKLTGLLATSSCIRAFTCLVTLACHLSCASVHSRAQAMPLDTHAAPRLHLLKKRVKHCDSHGQWLEHTLGTTCVHALTLQAEIEPGVFCGLALDQDNQDDLTPARVQKWCAQVKQEMGV